MLNVTTPDEVVAVISFEVPTTDVTPRLDTAAHVGTPLALVRT